MWWGLPVIFQGAGERFLSLAKGEAILTVPIVGMELSNTRMYLSLVERMAV
jgi:hypothetical protein